MHIPERLAELLRRDTALDGAVRLSIAQFTPWIAHSHLPFFPEYTDHGIDHLDGVLRTAVGLIADEAWDVLTPADAAVLTISVLLHDCALHLSEDGFFALLEQARDAASAEAADANGPRARARRALPQDPPWNVLWEDFFAEARRFDGRTLTRLFGDAQPVRRPPDDPRDLTKRDRLLIGEFLRRHHPRLAHEITLTGVPLPTRRGKSAGPVVAASTSASMRDRNPLVLEGFSGAHADFAALAGLVARSHGVDVRAFLPHLREHFDARTYKGVHPTFLMVLLRVADYLQLEAERAPAAMLQVRRLSSPYSRGEWSAHHAIRDIRHTHEDPEAIFIDAFPEDVHTCLKVQSWLAGIQDELDASWAVLGEIYGRYAGLNRLGLVIRRVRSSLDDRAAFASRVSYVPVRAAFRADANVMKLMIEPLYGNRPEFALRELIQNGVDAVRELDQYLRDVPTARDVPRPDLAGDVVAEVQSLGDGHIDVIVSDRGIGMTERVILDYFLVAGASFRKSEQWRKAFETKDGASRVLRTGRFGIGALASFLLGPEIEVSTRHPTDARGYTFRASVDAEEIELRRIDRPVGTTIRVRSDRLAITRMMSGATKVLDPWDWYCLSSPSVVRTMYGYRCEQRHRVPDASGAPLSHEWRRLPPQPTGDVVWSHTQGPALACNGFAVRGQAGVTTRAEEEWRTRVGLKLPNVAVADPDGRFPLNLQRTALAVERSPFDEALAEDVMRDFLAFALVNGPTAFNTAWASGQRTYPGSLRNGASPGGATTADWYFTPHGFGFADASSLGACASVLLVKGELSDAGRFIDRPAMTSGMWAGGEHLEWWCGEFLTSRQRDGRRAWTTDGEPSTRGGDELLADLPRSGVRLLMGKAFRAQLLRTLHATPSLVVESASNDWTLCSVGNCAAASFDFARVARQTDGSRQHVVLAECLLKATRAKPSPVAAAWLRIFGQAEIPYDLVQRRKELAHAYETLAPYVRAHEQANADRARFERTTSAGRGVPD